MTKGLKIAAICVAIAVVVVTLYKGGQAVVAYIEGKAVADVSNRQLEDSIKVQTEASQTIVDFNRDLTQQVADSADFFSEMNDRIDRVIEERKANAVELPEVHVLPATPTKPSASIPTTRPIEAVTGDEELVIAWETFCKIRPSYKDCSQGTRP